MSMQFGVFLPNVPPPLLAQMALQAEALGYDCLWGSDHLMSPFPPVFPDFPAYYEAWTLASYLAGITKTIKISHQVLIPAFRNAAVLANGVATLDQLSGGRVILTTGAGWDRREFEAYGIPWGTHGERIEREREAIRLMRALWTEPRVTFEGKHYRLKDAVSEPKPLQQPSVPIWVGGGSRQTIELAAELADGWLMHGHSPSEVASLVSRIEPLLGSRRASGFTFATSVFAVLETSETEAEEKLARIIPDSVRDVLMKAPVRLELTHRIAGPPAACVRRIREYESAGIGHLVLIFVDPTDMIVFAEEVMPELRSGRVAAA